MSWLTMTTEYEYRAGSDVLTLDDYKVIDAFVMGAWKNVPDYPTNDGIIPNSNICNATLDWNSTQIQCSTLDQARYTKHKKSDIAKMLTRDTDPGYSW